MNFLLSRACDVFFRRFHYPRFLDYPVPSSHLPPRPRLSRLAGGRRVVLLATSVLHLIVWKYNSLSFNSALLPEPIVAR